MRTGSIGGTQAAFAAALAEARTGSPTVVVFAAMRALLVAALALLLADPAGAGVERVWVARGSQDEITVQRGNGDLWRLGLDRQCPALSGYASRLVLIHFAASFPGPAPRILVPELDLECRATRADSVGHRRPPAAREKPEAGLAAMRAALEGLGFNCGPLDERGWTADAAQAFTRYRESRRLEASPWGLKRAITALAIDAIGGRSPSASGLRRSQTISESVDEILDYLVNGGSAECGEPTSVRGAAPDGSYFTLVDGTVWDVEIRRRGAVAAWLASDGVMACSGRLVNLRTGEMARATRLR